MLLAVKYIGFYPTGSKEWPFVGSVAFLCQNISIL
jgi:hypothetical protein